MRLSSLLLIVFCVLFANPSSGSVIILSQSDYLEQADSCAKKLNYDCAIDLYTKALSFQQGDSTLNTFLSIHNQIGDIYYKQGYFNKANRSYQLVLRYAQQYGEFNEKAQALMGQSHILWRYGDNVNSIQNILESIDLFRSLEDTSDLVSASNILAGIYVSTGELKKASNIYEETLTIAIAGKDSIGMASSYEYKGVVKSFKGQYSDAIKFYLKSLSINLKIGNELDAGITYANIGEAYLRLSDYKNALEYLSISEEILRRHNFNSGLIFVNYCGGESYMRLEQFSRAHNHFDESLDLIELTGESREKPTVLALKAECYALEGKFKDAYSMHRIYASAKDSLNTSNQNDQLMQIMGQYEFEKQEQENLFLQQENEIKEKELESQQSIIQLQYVIGGIMFLFLAVVIYLFVKLYKNKVLLDYANQAKNRLFGFVAHDIKSPLGNLQMLVHMLNENFFKDKKEQTRLLSELSNCAYSVEQLTDDLIAWSVAQQSGLHFNPENVLIGEVVKDCLELFHYQIDFKKVVIEDKVPPYLEVYADRKALMSIVRNIISNAIKFSDTGGFIELNANESKEKKSGKAMIELKCKDEGIGMTKEKSLSLVSKREVETTRGTANEKGNGLGLNLVKEFVKKSHGYIKIKSKPNVGTKFSVFLPAAVH
ncbi:MAG: tetratricopeptide repeat-containing sensor histidine kinase [Reichenbachiella sp.]|uniref:tetratricopeptide repeat-containing sensor histidine kinase n=1 Tax=Reichenbachiella sp. TaxID=2184521 RepID=UPI003299C00E